MLRDHHVAYPFVQTMVDIGDMPFEQSHGDRLLAWKILIQCSNGNAGFCDDTVRRPCDIAVNLENLSSRDKNRIHRYLGTMLNRLFSGS